jgi:tetratricopeptide (TPR) repeat protein
MKRFSAIIVAGLILSLATPTLRAEEDAADIQARQLFKEGVRLFKDGDNEGASIAFNRAYELRPSYKILYNVGQVESELKHYCRALEAYMEYIEAGGDEIDPGRKAEVEAQINRLRIFVGSVEISYGEDGVTVLIDEERYGATPLEAVICVDMGTHDLSLRKGVEEIYRESFRIAGGQQLTMNLGGGENTEETVSTTPPEPEDSAAEEQEGDETAEQTDVAPSPGREESQQHDAADTPSRDTERKKRKWTWISLGAGAAIGAVGGIVGGIAMAKESQLDDMCDGFECEQGDKGLGDTISRLNLTADVLYGVAGACAVTAVVLFFVEPKRAESKVAVAPTILPESIGLGLKGRF